jgi:hypothetical protein
MKNTFRTLVLASAAMAAAATATLPAMAETSTTLNVPFSFTVDGHILPAGEYSVVRDDTRNFVKLRSRDYSATYSFVASPTADRSDRVILRFDGQSENHALQSVQYGPLVTARLDGKKKENITPQYSVVSQQ